MSDAGAPSFPQPGQYRSETPQRSFNSDFRIGNLERAPRDIEADITTDRRPVRLEGEVTRVSRDENIRVRITTNRGDVDVSLPADDRFDDRVDDRQTQRPPQIGQNVTIDIEPLPRNTPEQAPQVTIRPAAVTVTPEAQNQSPPAPRISSTPVQIELSDGQTRQAPQTPQVIRPEQLNLNAPPPLNIFPEIGSLARLEPLAPQQFEQLIQTRQLLIPEITRQRITPLPTLNALNILPQSGQQPAIPIVSPVPQATLPDLTPELNNLRTGDPFIQPTQITPANNQLQNQPETPQSNSLPILILQPALNILLAQALEPPANPIENLITVPVLTRAQEAAAQIQNIVNNTQASAAPITPAPQDIRITNIQPPQTILTSPNTADNLQQTTPPLTGTPKAAQFSGIVIAKTQTQIPIVQFSIPQNITSQNITSQNITQQNTTQPFVIEAPANNAPVQNFILQFPSEILTIGSRIDAVPQNLIPQATLSETAAPQSPQPLPFANIAVPQNWPVLHDIQQTLSQNTAQAAAIQSAQAFTGTLPNPANSAQFAPAILFFIAAVRGGDLGSWLGDKTAQILRQNGKGNLISRLGAEATAPRTVDAPPGEWRGMNIPLFWNGDIKQMILHYKHDAHSGSASDQDSHKGTRFVFDLNLDVMGKVQLDGLFRPVSRDGPRLDVVLRTEERFSTAMQSEMRRIYMDAIKPSQIGGELSFQNNPDSWVTIDAQNTQALGVSA